MIQIFDDVLSPVTHRQLTQWVPAEILNNKNTVRYNNTSEYKNALDLQHIRNDNIRKALARLQIIAQKHLEQNTNALGICVDPKGRGCGIHHLPKEGFLDLHVDGNWHPELQKRRFANAVYYVSGDNSSPFHINYETIPFVPNRMVLFTTLDEPVHGCPIPVETDRYTLSIFFYCDGEKPRFPRRAWFPNATAAFTQERTPLK